MKKIYVIMAVCLVILAGIFIYMQVDRFNDTTNGEYDLVKDLETLKVLGTENVSNPIDPPESSGTEEDDTGKEEPEPTLDFDTLWEKNTDICAWIEINGTLVDYPVVSCPVGDDEKYLRRALNGEYYIGGTLFIQERYSKPDFSDRITVIYGHTMPDETLFGQLEKIYSNDDTFDAHNDIKIYLPDRVEHYTVFAAVPFDSIHIPATYDFNDDYWYSNFFNGVKKIRHLSATVREDIFPDVGDRVLILSTCMNENSNYRYLVMAINRDDIKK